MNDVRNRNNNRVGILEVIFHFTYLISWSNPYKHGRKLKNGGENEVKSVARSRPRSLDFVVCLLPTLALLIYCLVLFPWMPNSPSELGTLYYTWLPTLALIKLGLCAIYHLDAEASHCNVQCACYYASYISF